MNVDLAFVKPLFIRSFIWAFCIVLFASVITGQGALASLYAEETFTTVNAQHALTGGTGYELNWHVEDWQDMYDNAVYYYIWEGPCQHSSSLTSTTGIKTGDIKPSSPFSDKGDYSIEWDWGSGDTWHDCSLQLTLSNVGTGVADSTLDFWTMGFDNSLWQNQNVNVNVSTGSAYAPHDGRPVMVTSSSGDRIVGVHSWYTEGFCTPPLAAFAADNVYTNKGVPVSFTDLSTGTEPFTYLWDLDDINYNTEIIEHTFGDYGDYNVSLKVTNDCGSDWENKTDYIHVQMFQNWTPVPTVVPTYIPWTNVTFFNMTEYRQDIEDNPLIGNMTTPVLDLFDDVLLPLFDFFQLFSGFMSFPFTTVTQYLATVTGIFDDIMPEFTSLMAVPLVITGKVINMIPYQVQMVITLAIIFDIILLIVRGE